MVAPRSLLGIFAIGLEKFTEVWVSLVGSEVWVSLVGSVRRSLAQLRRYTTVQQLDKIEQ